MDQTDIIRKLFITGCALFIIYLLLLASSGAYLFYNNYYSFDPELLKHQDLNIIMKSIEKTYSFRIFHDKLAFVSPLLLFLFFLITALQLTISSSKIIYRTIIISIVMILANIAAMLSGTLLPWGETSSRLTYKIQTHNEEISKWISSEQGRDILLAIHISIIPLLLLFPAIYLMMKLFRTK